MKWPLKLRKLLYRWTPRRAGFLNQNPWLADHAIGDYSYGSIKVLSWRKGSKLQIGRFCSIAPNVTIMLDGEHRTDWVTTYPFPEFFPAARNLQGDVRTKGDVVIGHDVWIGDGAMILSGVTIGNGAVIGARSVVTKAVPSYAIAAGNPARVVRLRFTEAQIQQLEAIAWWDWPVARIQEALPLLLAPDIDAFIAQNRVAVL